MFRLLWLLCCLLLSACVAAIPALPSRSGNAWLRLESAHFIVLTNQDAEDASATLRELEHFYAIFDGFGWTSIGVQPVKVSAVVFENDIEFHAFVPHRWDGVFLARAPYAPLIVTYNAARGRRSTVILHELVHYLISLSTPRAPAWFQEGVASYFQTAAANVDNDEVSVGRPDPALADLLRHEGILPVENLLDPERDTHGRTFYPSAWLLVHYLMTHQGDGLIAFHHRLIEGEEPDAAWAASFPGLTNIELRVALEQYLERDEFTYAVRSMDLGEVPAQRTNLRDADVLALRALLFSLNIDNRHPGEKAHALAAADLRALNQLEDLHPLGTIVTLAHTPPPPDVGSRIANDLARAHPDEWTTWMLAIDWLQRNSAQPAEVLATATEALRHHPNHVVLLNAATDAALEANDDDRALAYARRAKQLRGSDAHVLIRYSMTLYRAGACDTADRVSQVAGRRLGWKPGTEGGSFIDAAGRACRDHTPIVIPLRTLPDAIR